ncbi:MAG: hypothetical protein IPJ97_03040 [Proteobacteria bacterium]|nr:hypothetical protein [Pseudomonadota bacterium]
MPQDQLIERRHRGTGIARHFGGARELIQGRVARLVLGIVAQQCLVRGDGFNRLRLCRWIHDLTLAAEGYCLLESQVAKPAQGLRPERRVRAIDLQERLVTVRGVLGRRLDRQRAIHWCAAARERAERRLDLLACALGRARPATGHDAGDGDPGEAGGAHLPPPFEAPSYSEARANCACVE